MKQHDNPSPTLTAALPTDELRHQFLVSGLFVPGALKLHAWEVDRTVLGAAIPVAEPLALPNPPELRATSFLERRELGVINLGGAGVVAVDGTGYALAYCDALYVGRGAKAVTFRSAHGRRISTCSRIRRMRRIRPSMSPSGVRWATGSGRARGPTSARSTR